jgi:large repetitive protein
MKKFLLSITVFILSFSSSFSQPEKDGALTVSALNTVLNKYSSVTADVNSGTSVVIVNSITTDLGGLAAGDLIMIYQAQGAAINTSNSITYGNVTAPNSAGLYEYKYVISISVNTITVDCNFANSYTLAGKTQVVKVPQYSTLTINAGASVTALPWQEVATRRFGGVVAIRATNLVLNGNINVVGQGFRGGAIDNNTSGANATIYTDFVSTSSSASAEKGEGIAGYQAEYDLLGGRYGRGAPANGGGGGNAHNSGGGGGSNGNNGNTWTGQGVMCSTCTGAAAWALDAAYIANGNALTNSSGGGRGGYTYSSSNQDALTLAPGAAAWGGDLRDNTGGFGGRPMNNAADTRIFLGGGGGAGDANNSATQRAGNGGGLVFIISTGITGSGNILASGENGLATIGGNNDAPGGGGGGGTIVIKSATIASTISATANGGIGGNQLITSNEAEGSGGGGGGGYIAISAGTPILSANGGANGTTTSASLTEFPANGTTSGGAGQPTNSVTNTFIPYLTTTASSNTPVCTGTSINLTTPTISGATYAWTGPNSFTSTTQNPIIAAATSAMAGVYNVTVTPLGCANITASTSSVVINPLPSTVILSITQPTCSSPTGSITVTSPTGAVTYSFDNGATFQVSPTKNGLTPGTYQVIAKVTSTGCNSLPTAGVINAVPNCNPVAVNNTITGTEDAQTTINVVTNDTDADGTINTSTVDLDPSTGGIQNTFTVAGQGTYTVNALGVVTFTPVANFNGIATPVNYTVQDNLGATSNIATITITITPSGPSFNCSEKGFLIQDSPSKLYELNLITGVSTIVMNPVSGSSEFNGLAYNPKDGFLYAKKLGANELIRIAADYSTATVTIAGLPLGGRVVGDIDTAGIYYLTTGSSTTLNRIDMNPNSPTNGTLLSSVTLPPGGLGTLDIGISYINNKGYAVTSGAAPHILKELNLSTGAITDIGTVTGDGSELENTVFGAAYMDSIGNFYFGSNNTGNIYKINQPNLLSPGAVASQFFSSGPLSANNDGARCGYAPVNIDFGDAPNSYGILLNTNGARHGIVGGLKIGSLIDAENNGVASLLANGDDTNGSDDEDGLTSPINISYLATSFTVSVPVTNTSFPTAKLVGWIDFNIDGNFQTSEAASVAAPNTGSVNLTWTGITPTFGTSYLRVRLSSDANLINSSPNTAMQNGEVEDYVVIFNNTTPVAVDNIVAVAITEDGANGTVNIITNDTDPDGSPTAPTNGVGQFSVDLDPLTVGLQTTFTNLTGTWTYNATTGVVTFDPALNYNGTSTIAYELCDAGAPALCDQADITFTVTPVNDAPDAVDNIVATPLTEDGANGIVNIVTNDTDVDGNPTVPTNGVGQFTVDLNTGLAGIQTTITNAAGIWTYNTTTGEVTFDPANNFNGTATLPYQLCDPSAACDIANITFTVNGVNDAPVAIDNIVAVAITEDGANGTVNIITNDTDPDGSPTAPTNGVGQFSVDLDPLTVGLQTTFTNLTGTWTYNATTGVVTFDPALNYNGTSTIAYELCDAGAPALCDQADITFTVTPVNDAPDAVDNIVATPLTEDGANGIVNIVTNDTDVDGNPTVPTNGVGQFTVDLNTGLAGIQTTITNAAGIWTYNTTTGEVTFDPANNFNGTATLPYQLCDPSAACDIANITFTVNGVNDAPVAIDNIVAVAITEDGANGTVNIITNDTDPDGSPTAPTNGVGQFSVDLDPLTVGLQTTFTNLTGTWTYNATTGVVTFDPALNYNGTSTIAYELCDAGAPALCDQADITFTVTPVNDAPDAVDNIVATPLTEDGANGIVNIVTNDTDVDGNPTAPTNGVGLFRIDINTALAGVQTTVTNAAGVWTYNSALGEVTFNPANNFTGIATLPYELCDFGTPRLCDFANISFTVDGINDPPIVDNENITTSEDNPVSGDLTNAGDSDVDGSLVVDIVPLYGPNNGDITVNADGSFTYVPFADFNGTDTIVVSICDDGFPLPINCTKDTIFITINPVNDAPVLDNEFISVAQNQSASGDLTNAGDEDIDGTNLVVTLLPIVPPSNGDIIINLDGSYTYTPDLGFVGNDLVVVQICDQGVPLPAICVNDTIFINVLATVPPVADNNSASTTEEIATTFNVTDTDSDVDGTIDVSTVDLDISTAGVQNTITTTEGIWTVDNLGNVTFTPAFNFNGDATLSYTVNDNDGATSNEAELTVTVSPVNDSPVIDNENETAQEDTDVTGDLTNAGDSDVDGNLVVNTNPIVDPINGIIVINLDGTYTYTPNLNFNGSDTIVVEICDDGTPLPAVCVNDTIFITIDPVNDNPVADSNSTNTLEDTEITFNITATDTDLDGTIDEATVDLDPLTLGIQNTITTLEGIWSVDNLGNVTFIPAQDFNGDATITYTVNDNEGGISNTANLTVSVTPVNDLPVLDNEILTAVEESDVTGDLTDGGDSDVDGNLVVNINPVSGPANGEIVVNSDGTFTYTPDLNFAGTDTIVVEICDDGTPLPSICVNDTIFITINPVNDAPVVDNEFISVGQNLVYSGNLIDAGDSDPDGTNLISTTTPVVDATNGNIVVNNDGTYEYTPNLDYIGADTIVIEICDQGLPLPAICVNDTIFINILPTVPPVADNNSVNTLEDTEVNFNVTDTDTDIDGTINETTVDLDPSTAGIQDSITTIEGTWTVDSNGNVTFSPAPDFNGDAIISYTVNDNLGATSNIAQIIVTVNPVNDTPIVDNEIITGVENTDFTGDLTNSGDADLDGNLVVNTTPSSGPNNGVITIDEDGTFTYTPDLNFNGSDTIVVEICDDGTPLPAICVNDTIFIIIDPINDSPIVDNENITVIQNQASTGDLTNGGDADPDGTELLANTIPLVDPANGTITINVDGTYEYTPNLDFIGTDTVVIEICDQGLPLPAICVNDTIFITVTDAVPPVANADSSNTLEDTPVTFNILENDTDVDGTIDPATVDLDVLTAGIQNTITTAEGTWTVDNLGNVTFTPALNFNGSASISYTVNDNDGLISNTGEITVQVAPVNDDPSVDNENITTNEDTDVSGDLTDTGDNDVDGNLVVTTTPISGPSNGVVLINADGTFTYTPNLNFNGSDTIVVEICDDGTPLPVICVTDTIFINVTPINDIQSQGNETIVVSENTTEENINVLANNIDPDGEPLIVAADLNSAQGGTVVVNLDGSITYTPALDYLGADTIFYTVCDLQPIPNCVSDTIFITVQPDNDGDGVTDAQDIDDDNDGITDLIECLTALNICDTDGDGVSDVFDLDSDNDGISDIFEAGGSTFDANNDGVIDNSIDSDNDGLFDAADGNNGGSDLPVTDTDGDNHPDFQDLDSDNDGINDITESGNNVLADLNSDGIVDGPDTDGDGINDSADPDNGGSLSDPVDTDFDGHPDFQDLDSDNDGLNDIIESGNPVLDTDNNGVVDGPDADGDGINDSADANDTTFGDPDITDEPVDTDNDGDPDYNDLDSDNDGIKDVIEGGNGDADTDGDGRVDGVDTDGDGILDPVDENVNDFGDQGNNDEPLDSDGDGKPNYIDLDSDNDGINDGIDNEIATEDCDADGISNYIDADPCGLFIPDGFSPNGDGVNDVLTIKGIENYPNNTFEIFNRWGNRVLDSKPYNNTWNGVATEGLRIGTEQLPVGTYFYVLDLGDGSEIMKGYIYLNR